MIDVLLASYNGEKYIAKQIESILNQSIKNLRLIISDDFSTDSTQDIIKAYSIKDSRVLFYFQEENLGYIKNFEFLLGKADKDFIAFSDQDDIWHVNKLETLMNTIIAEDTDLAYCDARIIDENGNKTADSYMSLKSFPAYSGKGGRMPYISHFSIGCSQLFTRRLKDAILPFKNVMAHDWITVFMASRLNGISYVSKPLLDYRKHSSNVFGGKSTKANIDKAKAEYGTKYKNYLEYRKFVIDKNYLLGAKMCFGYFPDIDLAMAVKYYEHLKKVSFISFNFVKFKKYIKGEKNFKRCIKEGVISLFPLLGYFAYRLVKY